jgi:hypothetical protein
MIFNLYAPTSATINEIWLIALFVGFIALTEAGIIIELSMRVGSFKRLFKLTAFIANKRKKRPYNKKCEPKDLIDK